MISNETFVKHVRFKIFMIFKMIKMSKRDILLQQNCIFIQLDFGVL